MLLLSSTAHASDAICKTGRTPIAPCFTVKGRIFITGDRGAVLDAKSHEFLVGFDDDYIPDSVVQILMEDHFAAVDGIYKVCPTPDTENQFGVAHAACVGSVSHLSISHPFGQPRKAKPSTQP